MFVNNSNMQARTLFFVKGKKPMSVFQEMLALYGPNRIRVLSPSLSERGEHDDVLVAANEGVPPDGGFSKI